MKVLIYSHAFAPHAGGIETVVMSLARGLAEETGTPDDMAVTVVTQTSRQDFDDSSLPFQVVRQPGFLRLARQIWTADVVHLAGPCLIPMLLGFLFRKPVVVEHHGFQTICPNGQLLYEPTQTPCPGHFMAARHGACIRCNAGAGLLRSFGLWALTFPRRWLCGRALVNIAPTNWLRGLLCLPRTTTVHHGVPAQVCRASTASPADPARFAFVGRLVSAKGVETLLQAARRLREQGRDFRLCIIGDGAERRKLEEQAKVWQLEDSVEFPGYLPPEQLEARLSQAATVVMPSLAGEVFGMVALENMARGKLLLVSDIGAMREVVGNTGLCFAPGDAEGLTRGLHEVLDTPNLAMKLGEDARRRAAQEFSTRRMIAGHRNLYRLASNRTAASGSAALAGNFGMTPGEPGAVMATPTANIERRANP